MKTLSGLNTQATALTKVLRDVRKRTHGYFRIAGFRVTKEVKATTWLAAKKLSGDKFPGHDRELYTRKREVAFTKGDAGILLLPEKTAVDYKDNWGGEIKGNTSAFFFNVQDMSWGHISDGEYKKLMSASDVSESNVEQVMDRKKQEMVEKGRNARQVLQTLLTNFHKDFFADIEKNLKYFEMSAAPTGDGIRRIFQQDYASMGIPQYEVRVQSESYGANDFTIEISSWSGSVSEATDFKKFAAMVADCEYILSKVPAHAKVFREMTATDEYKEAFQAAWT